MEGEGAQRFKGIVGSAAEALACPLANHDPAEWAIDCKPAAARIGILASMILDAAVIIPALSLGGGVQPWAHGGLAIDENVYREYSSLMRGEFRQITSFIKALPRASAKEHCISELFKAARLCESPAREILEGEIEEMRSGSFSSIYTL